VRNVLAGLVPDSGEVVASSTEEYWVGGEVISAQGELQLDHPLPQNPIGLVQIAGLLPEPVASKEITSDSGNRQ
jgi:hypothetical protein